MPKATWNGTIIADSNQCIVVEGNQYFPPDSVNRKFLRSSDHETFCSWKGTASYYDLVVDDQVNEGAAWFYREPMQEAAQIRDYVAFWRGVIVEE
jgi:uncharacterized protein (DUF427 family)